MLGKGAAESQRGKEHLPVEFGQCLTNPELLCVFGEEGGENAVEEAREEARRAPEMDSEPRRARDTEQEGFPA